MRANSFLSSYLRAYRASLVIGCILSFVASVLGLLIPLFLIRAVDATISKQNLDDILLLCFLLGAVMVIRAGCLFFQGIIFSNTGVLLVSRLKEEMFSKVLKLRISFLNREPSGAWMSRIMKDTEVIQALFSSQTGLLFISPVTIIGCVGGLFALNIQLTLLAILSIPVLAFVLGQLGKKMKNQGQITQEQTQELGGFLSDAFQGIRVIKSFVIEELMNKIFSQRNRNLKAVSLNRVRLQSLFSPLVDAMGGVVLGVMLYLTSSEVQKGTLTFGEVVAYLLYLNLLFLTLSQVSPLYALLKEVEAASDRLDQVMRQPEEIPSRNTTSESFTGRIVSDCVSFAYGETSVLESVTFSAYPGELTVLVGNNGAGKSTILSLLLRFYSPQAGTIYLDGKDIQSLSLDELRRMIAIVPQDIFLFNTTIRENILLGHPTAGDEQFQWAARLALCDKFIVQFPMGYDTVVGERGILLSAGQRQRIAIARALIKDAPVLILDEGTQNLDPDVERSLLKNLEILSVQKTVLLLTPKLLPIIKDARIISLNGKRSHINFDNVAVFSHDNI